MLFVKLCLEFCFTCFVGVLEALPMLGMYVGLPMLLTRLTYIRSNIKEGGFWPRIIVVALAAVTIALVIPAFFPIFLQVPFLQAYVLPILQYLDMLLNYFGISSLLLSLPTGLQFSVIMVMLSTVSAVIFFVVGSISCCIYDFVSWLITPWLEPNPSVAHINGIAPAMTGQNPANVYNLTPDQMMAFSRLVPHPCGGEEEPGRQMASPISASVVGRDPRLFAQNQPVSASNSVMAHDYDDYLMLESDTTLH